LIRKAQAAGEKNSGSIMLVYASDPRFMDSERKQFIEKWGKDSEITRVSGNVDPGELTGYFQNRGIFEIVTVLHIVYAEKLSPASAQTLLEFFQKPVKDVAILVEYGGDLSEKNRRLEKVWKEMAVISGAVNCNPASAKSYILKRVKTEGIKIDDEAMESLEIWANKDLALLPSALDLLCLAAMETKSITSMDVAELLGTGGSPNIFQLQDRFLQRDREGIISTVKKIESDENSAPLAFVSVISKQLHLMMKIHSLVGNDNFLQEIRPDMVDKSLAPWQFEKVKRDIPKWPPEETFSAMNAMTQLDKALKGDPGEPWATVERHLLLILTGNAKTGLSY
jgi:DNA polymerase III delta subunit